MEAIDLFKNQVQKNPSSHRSGYLLGPKTDFFMIGGGSLFYFGLFFFLSDPQSQFNHLGWSMFFLSFAVNFPHFLISYILFYGHYRKDLVSKPKNLFVGFSVPLLMIGFFYSSVTYGHSYLPYLVNLMFFLVGWHYVKQIYGCVMMVSYINDFSWSKWEKFSLRQNMYSLWALSFINSNTARIPYNYHGITYETLNLPYELRYAAYAYVGLSLSLVAFLTVKKFIEDGRWPPLNAFVAFLSIYAWYIPTLYHPGFFMMIPFFHSLQYLLFVGAYYKNRAQDKSQHLQGAQRRKKMVLLFLGPLLLATLLGGLAFRHIPQFLDSMFTYNTTLLGATFFVFCFDILINIHHYFIDNVIWRANIPEVKNYLLKKQ